jgi:hypothetical protein|tara:strand:+ start:3375 stop:4655 length:1281 start_codon:yes stop_codon:yes gene_type:complete
VNDYIKFLIIFFLSVGQVLLLVVGFNWWVDPYGVFRPAGHDPQKPVWMSKQLRLAKAQRVKQLKPQGIVIGTSTSQSGIDPDHPGWDRDVYPRYNLALPATNSYENFRYFQHAHALNPLKQVLIGLDFVSFNIFSPLSGDFNESHLIVSRVGKSKDQVTHNLTLTLLSLSAIKASQKKLFFRGKGTHSSNGREIPQKENPEPRNNRSAMMGSATKFVPRLLMPPPSHRFCLYDGMGNNPNFQYLRKILEISKEDGLDVRLFIQPAHAYLLEVLRIMGMMQDYEKWQRELITLIEDVNHRYPESPEFPLWDFSGYNSVTMDEVPPPETPSRPMRWYVDIGHYSKALGDIIQDRIFSFHEAGRVVPEDFGVQINSKNIDRHQTSRKIKQREYMQTYQEDIKELTGRVNAIKKKIRPIDCNQVVTRTNT